MKPAIYFHPEAYSISGPKLMGRNSAGESFMRGLLKHSTAQEFWALVPDAKDAQLFVDTVVQSGRTEPVKVIGNESLGALANAGTLYLPGPRLSEYAWHRANYGHRSWSLCGITHTTCSASSMDAIADFMTAPVQPWDALICTSSAVKSHVQHVLQEQQNYLKERLGATKFTLPQLPIIPLGVHTQEFSFTLKQREKARQRLGIDPNAIVVLFMGRLSFHAKAHPLAMYQALELAVQKTEKEVVLVECGVHATSAIKDSFAEAAREACPNVRVITLNGRLPDSPEIAWAGADMFCSFSDNIQEAFGITPIEAMAAGLPVVVSDWDGYKDTVVDGETGYRIPTLQPAAGFGGDLAYRYALNIDSYDRFCAFTSAVVAIDIDKAAQAFIELIESPEKCKTMGEKGRKRAMEVYDWSVIIPQYEALWRDLETLRLAQSDNQPHVWPARLDPFYGFEQYPTQALNRDTMLVLRNEAALSFLSLRMISFADYIIPAPEELNLVITQARKGPQKARQLIANLPISRQPYVLRSLAWLVKIGVLSVHI